MFAREQFSEKLYGKLYGEKGGQTVQAQFVNNQILGNIIYEHCIDDACVRHGLIRTEMDILLFLHNNPGFDTATDIVKLRHLSKSHVSKSVQSLKERGFLTACHQDGNRRTIHLQLLPAADAAVTDGLRAQERFVSILLADFAEEEKAQFQKYLCRITDNLQAHLRDRHQ